jgi:hypothetical protein
VTSYWATNGFWDVKGFQWGDPDTTYPSDFAYNWYNGIISIWIKDSEGDHQPTVVGTARQGSVWDSNAPWYDYPPTYQPTPLHFAGKSSIILTSSVCKDSAHRYSWDSWINWLFNPWFKVTSTYNGVTRERRMVWDIVWAWENYLPFSMAHNYIDMDSETVHLAFNAGEMAQTGEWKSYTIDFLNMANQAKALAAYFFGWSFNVEDLYMWSIDVLVEGYNYDSRFSVDNLKIEYDTPSSGGCPFVSVWDGNGYALDNNVLPAAEASNGTDVEDYYKLEQTLVPNWEGRQFSIYSLKLSEFENEHSYIDQVRLLAVDHDSDFNIALTPDGEILTYRSPAAPLSAVDNYGNSRLNEINQMDGNVSDPATYFYGAPDDYIILNFGQVNADNAKLILRDDMLKKDECIEVQVKDNNGTWQTVDTVLPRAYWSIEAVNLSPNIISGQDFWVRLFWKNPHRLDFVGLDTTTQESYELHTGTLVSAVHSTEGNVKPQLLTSDNLYAELIPDQQILLAFKLPNSTDQTRTYIFYVEGHYFKID